MKIFIIRKIYNFYSLLRIYYLKRFIFLDTYIFNFLVKAADYILSERVRNVDPLYKFMYSQFFANTNISVDTKKPVAFDSSDHIKPRGTLRDNSSNYSFNLKAYQFFNYKKISVLDLGCSGGAMVKSFIDDGHFAVGIEGSDISKKYGLGEWATIPKHLHTADLTENFTILLNKKKKKFNLITMWEVLEHIPKKNLENLLSNIYNHLEDGGVFIGSIDFRPDGDVISKHKYHLTLESRSWWENLFLDNGFELISNHNFLTSDFVRGNGLTLKDWDPKYNQGMHVVASKK